jgi:hypothetical protein
LAQWSCRLDGDVIQPCAEAGLLTETGTTSAPTTVAASIAALDVVRRCARALFMDPPEMKVGDLPDLDARKVVSRAARADWYGALTNPADQWHPAASKPLVTAPADPAPPRPLAGLAW